MKTIFTTLIMSLAILSACNTTNPASGNTEEEISGIEWYLKKIYLPAGNTTVENRQTFIKFDGSKNSAGGKGGCNSFGSNYKLTGNSISFKNIFSTKMYCEKYQNQEESFFRQLERTNRFELKEGRLLLYIDNELLLELSK